MKSLSRGTSSALEGAVLGAEDSASGKTVVFSKVVESLSHLGNVTLYIDDGSGTAESHTTVTSEAVITALGGEVDPA